jgi:hypothetical protein
VDTLSEIKIRICDNCGEKKPMEGLVGWFRLDRLGIDISIRSDPKLPADLCSGRCIVAHLTKMHDLRDIQGSLNEIPKIVDAAFRQGRIKVPKEGTTW